MLNSYKTIVEGMDPAIIIESNKGYFIHHPSDTIDKNTLEVLLEYYEGEEDYDKCIDIASCIKEAEEIGGKYVFLFGPFSVFLGEITYGKLFIDPKNV